MLSVPEIMQCVPRLNGQTSGACSTRHLEQKKKNEMNYIVRTDTVIKLRANEAS